MHYMCKYIIAQVDGDNVGLQCEYTNMYTSLCPSKAIPTWKLVELDQENLCTGG